MQAARRLSTAAASDANAAASRAAASNTGVLQSLRQYFKTQPIEERPELRVIRSVQLLAAKVPDSPVATVLTAESQPGNFQSWLQARRASISTEHVDKDAFQALTQDVTGFFRELEASMVNERPRIPPVQLDDEPAEEDSELLDAYLELLKVKLARHKCEVIGQSFAELDYDNDGKIAVSDLETLLSRVVTGTPSDWLRCQFELHDADADDVVNESESQKILDSIVLTQKAVLAEILSLHVDHMPKKHMKLFESAVNETNWKEKIPEKIRCVFHFAPKEDEEKKLIHWETLVESQAAEIPELHDMLRVYAKGFYDERYLFYERKQEKRSLRWKGFFMAIALGVGDYIFMLT
ncbi:hypothetical protein ATCC90586_006178 [Pythium insidiosum]|nr:hypothetical protein ATCC90586_006178 [Pythium insidiosum]